MRMYTLKIVNYTRIVNLFYDNSVNPPIMRYLKTKIILTPTTRVYTSSSFNTILGGTRRTA